MIEAENRPPATFFYDSLAEDYDLMTDFRVRLAAEEPVFRKLVDGHGIRRALDAGAGTGLHSMILTRVGVRVTAVDESPSMLQRLTRNAETLGMYVDTIESSLEELSLPVPGIMDAVFCLGNTIAHVHGDETLRLVFSRFSKTLRPDGLLLMQVPNYEKILRESVRLQDVREREGTIFVRYYDFEPKYIRFNILTVKQAQGYSHQSVNLRPLIRTDFLRLLREAGFSQPDFFGGLSLQGFNPLESKELVILARKEKEVS